MNPNDIHEPDPIVTTMANDVDLLNPYAGSIDLDEVIKSLAGIRRYGGHIPNDITVLQHLLICDGIASVMAFNANGADENAAVVNEDIHTPYVRMCILLHDAAEAYIGDIVRPLKKLVNERADGLIDEIEEALDMAILTAVCGFRVYTPNITEAAQIKDVDSAALAAEVHTLWPELAESGRWGSLPEAIPYLHTVIVKEVMGMSEETQIDFFHGLLARHVGLYVTKHLADDGDGNDGDDETGPAFEVEDADPLHDVDTDTLVEMLEDMGFYVVVVGSD